jgi:geranylgeranyl reductase family protein
MMFIYDVAVVGAGPAGSTAAYLLATAGRRVALLERASFPRDKPCGGGVTARALAEAPLDIRSVVEHEVSRVRFSFRLGRYFDYEYSKTLVYMTQRLRLDAFLAEAACRAGADLLEGCQVRSLERHDGIQVLETARGEILARVVLGADGANGAVARSLGLSPWKDPPVAVEANVAYAGGRPGEWDGFLALELGSMYGGYGWSFPKADHFNVGCGGWRLEGARLRSHVRALVEHYSLEGMPVEFRGHHLPTRDGRSPLVKGGALLVGDAAGLVDPMSGEGIYGAFVSGRLAAESARRYLEGAAADLSPYEAAVERELMPDIRAAALLRDAYHYLPGASYALMRRWPYLRRALCQLMLGERTYAAFLRQAGPLRGLVALVAALGRRHQGRRERRSGARSGPRSREGRLSAADELKSGGR